MLRLSACGLTFERLFCIVWPLSVAHRNAPCYSILTQSISPSDSRKRRRMEERIQNMIEMLKWKMIDLLIRYRVLAPCYVRSDRRTFRR